MKLLSAQHCTILLVVAFISSAFAGIGHFGAEGAGGSFGGGDGSAGNPYVIEDVWDLQNMSSDLSAHYVLKKDINASATGTWNSGAGFVPIGNSSSSFTGSFDGKNHTITGLFIDRPKTDYVGLFGFVGTNGFVKNVGLVDNNVTGSNYVGGLVGYKSMGTVNNSYATGNVKGRSFWIGGLVGRNNQGTVNNSYATGNVRGLSRYNGGLVGSNHGTVANSYATGNVTGSTAVGGLVGYNSGTVSNSHATGYVTGYSDVGGLVGTNNQGTVSNCFWDKVTSGMSSSDGGTGKTTAEMKTRSTFTNAGWDFTSVWCMNENVTYPFLSWQEKGPPTANAGPNRIVGEGTLATFDGSGSSDDVGIASYTWTFTYDGEAQTLEGEVVQFTFDVAGVYDIVLTVLDLAGNVDSTTIVITVVDMGTVTGTVLDSKGNPIEAATVELTASDGGTHKATTGADGTFEMDIPHGAFTWKVSKKGFKAVSGESSVDAMGETGLDLSDQPLKKEEESPGFGMGIICLALLAAAMLSMRKRSCP